MGTGAPARGRQAPRVLGGEGGRARAPACPRSSAASRPAAVRPRALVCSARDAVTGAAPNQRQPAAHASPARRPARTAP